MNYKLKYKFNKPDTRDYIFKPVLLNAKISPTNYIITAKCGILDQGNLGSCVSNASSIAINISTNGNLINSRLFLYYCCRDSDGSNIQQDTGSTVRSICKAIKNYGLTAETNWAYDITKFSKLPSINCFTNQYKINSFIYNFINLGPNLINDIKNSLLSNNVVLFGMYIYSSFMTITVKNTGLVPIPNKTKEKLMGGHCMAIIGFDDIKNSFICQNSWGIKWGDKGKCYIKYKMITDSKLCLDFTNIVIK
jgi:C1A family cysteine protease